MEPNWCGLEVEVGREVEYELGFGKGIFFGIYAKCERRFFQRRCKEMDVFCVIYVVCYVLNVLCWEERFMAGDNTFVYR